MTTEEKRTQTDTSAKQADFSPLTIQAARMFDKLTPDTKRAILEMLREWNAENGEKGGAK